MKLLIDQVAHCRSQAVEGEPHDEGEQRTDRDREDGL
jgi:hypothetical protein